MTWAQHPLDCRNNCRQLSLHRSRKGEQPPCPHRRRRERRRQPGGLPRRCLLSLWISIRISLSRAGTLWELEPIALALNARARLTSCELDANRSRRRKHELGNLFIPENVSRARDNFLVGGAELRPDVASWGPAIMSLTSPERFVGTGVRRRFSSISCLGMIRSRRGKKHR
jgi:hypothetical protein